MFWKLTSLSTSSPIESILDKESFTLEELLDEEEIIQECKGLNNRLINFLRDRAQVERLLRYIIEEPLEHAESSESKRAFKFPFIACEIFTCEIDVILKTLAEEEELMNLLFSFLNPNRQHSALLAGYFSKVVISLMLRKAVPLINYVQAHQDVFPKLVNLIGITSIMEVLVRLVSTDDHLYPNSMDVMLWLADSNLLEMIVDKLSPSNPPEVHANAAETLCAITRSAPSPLATKISSPSFVTRIFGHALEDLHSKTGLIHSLSVCISLLDRRRSVSSPLFHAFRSQPVFESAISANPETVSAMLPKLGALLILLNLLSDEKILPTTYGELRPPLGKHRLKVVEFFAVLLKTGNEVAEKELVSSGTLKRVFDLFFEYPYNNALHHHVESIIISCLESKNNSIVDHLFQECNLLQKLLYTDKHPILSSDQPTVPTSGKQAPLVGNIGHITRISNKIGQLGNHDNRIHGYLQENSEWNNWQATVLQERNMVENIYRWACGRPTALQDRTRDSDEDDIHDRDYDVAALANNLSQAFRYTMYENDDAEEGHETIDRDDEDVYFDNESAEVVISSLRLGDDQGSCLFTNSNWFAFQDERVGDAPLSVSQSETMDEINLNETKNGGDSSRNDEVVIGENELSEGKLSLNGSSNSSAKTFNGSIENNSVIVGDLNTKNQNSSGSGVLSSFRLETSDEDPFEERPLPESNAWGDSSHFQAGSSINPFDDNSKPESNVNPFYDNSKPSSSPEATVPLVGSTSSGESLPNGSLTPMDSHNKPAGSDSSEKASGATSLFEEDVEFVGVELEGTQKATEHALKEGIVGEAEPLKRDVASKTPQEDSKDDGDGMKEFNDANYWKVNQEDAVLE